MMMTIPTTLNNCSFITVEQIQDTDVLCGSKNTSLGKHPGNVLLRKRLHHHISEYEQASTKQQKVTINRTIIKYMRTKYGSRFLRQKKNGDWVEMDEQGVRDKVSHGLRFALLQRQKEQEYQKQYVPIVQTTSALSDDEHDEAFTQTLEAVHQRQQQILENMMNKRDFPEESYNASFSSVEH